MSNAILWFIPHPLNGHKPLALRHRSLHYVAILLITIKLVAVGVIALIPSNAELSTITANRIVQLTNVEREKQGLAPLTVNDKLVRAATLKAQDMLKHEYFAHISPTGVTPWFWMKQSGYEYEVAGENLAIDFTEAEDVVSAWLASPTHKANVMHTAYTETGVAIASGEFEGSTSIIAVHMFGKSLLAVVPTPPVEPTAQVQGILQLAAVRAPVAVASPSPIPTTIPIPAPLEHIAPPAVIVLSPAFDHEQIAITAAAPKDPWQLADIHASLATDADVVSAVPLFTIHPASEVKNSLPSRIAHISRQFIGAILLSITFLLALTILVRIKIQHPFLIGHASLVIVLAFILLLA